MGLCFPFLVDVARAEAKLLDLLMIWNFGFRGFSWFFMIFMDFYGFSLFFHSRANFKAVELVIMENMATLYIVFGIAPQR